MQAAREILQEAFASNTVRSRFDGVSLCNVRSCHAIEATHGPDQDSEEIWLAAVKLENENSEPERAKMLLARARERAQDKPRVWMKSAKLEREQGEREEEKRILEDGLKKFPDYAKLWLMAGQYEEDNGDFESAKRKYLAGCAR